MSIDAQNELDRIIDFEPLIRRSLQGFVGRKWVRKEVADFLAQPGPRSFLVLGEPGSGKTSIMADLVALFGCPHHFIGKGSQVDVEGSPEWRNPVRFAESLGYQLVRDYGGWVMPWDKFGIDVHQEVKDLEGRLIGADIRVFNAIPRPSNARPVLVRQTVEQLGTAAQVIGVCVQELRMDVEQIVQLLLVEPVNRLAQKWPQDQVVVVIDGLDEAEYSNPKNSIVSLLPRGAFEKNVRFLLSARPTLDLPQEFRSQAYPLWLSKDPEDQWRQDDVRGDAIDFAKSLATQDAAISKVLDTRGVSVQDFAEKVAEASDGNFLYLYYFAKGLKSGLKQGDDSLLDLTDLPAGLSGIYNDFLGKIRLQAGGAWTHEYKPVLGALAVAREPLTVQQVARFAGVTEDTAGAVRSRLTEFLDPAAQQRYTLYHRSFAEFLVSKETLDPVSAAAAHGRIADAYLPAGFEAPWETWDAYGWRYVPSHLSEAALLSGDPVERHGRTERLVSLVLSQEFQNSESDSWALLSALELAAKTAAYDGARAALPMLVNTARELIDVRRRRLNPEDVFAAAERGDLAEAERRLDFFILERQWRQATRLVIAWLAAAIRPDAADDTAKRVDAELKVQPDPVLNALLRRVYAALGGPPPAASRIDKVPRQSDIRAAINLMAGLKDPEGQMVRRLGPEDLEGADGYAATCELIAEDAAGMAAYATKENDQQAQYVEEYLHVLERNTYVHYRNGFFFAFLSGLLQQAKQDWMLPRARQIAAAALGGNTLEFAEGLGLAIQAIRAKTNAVGAKEDLTSTIDGIRTEAVKAAQLSDDPWSMHLRRLTALGECLGYTEQDKDSASKCLKDAFGLWRGFAGFRAPACMTLAEAIPVIGLPPGAYTAEIALSEALAAAHNIQEATFCAYTTARVNAMMRKWMTIDPEAMDPLVRRFCADPGAAEFAPIHVVGEPYGSRMRELERTPLPDPMRDARSLHDIAANIYNQPPAELLRLNAAHREWDLTTPLRDDGAIEVRIPDPDFAPLLAARLAAGVLANRALRPHIRVELIRLLVPIAVSNPTALDTVLMRLLLAASYWLDTATLQQINGSVSRS